MTTANMTEQDEEFFYELSLQLEKEWLEELQQREQEQFEAYCEEMADNQEEHFFMDMPGEQFELFPDYQDLPF